MTETAILIYDNLKISTHQVSQESIPELARQVLADKSIVGILFYDRMCECGPPLAPKDKGGESQ